MRVMKLGATIAGWRRWFWRLIVGRKCIECGRRFWRGFDDELCSRKCLDQWFPF